MSLRRIAAVVLFLAAPAVFADAPGVYALTGATIHPVSGPDITNGTVVIRDGLIESVGAGVAIPRDATTIDVSGAHVYPGLIDAQTSLGFTLPKRGDKNVEPSADTLAARTAKLSDDEVDARRATGVTTIVTAPSNGIFNGLSAVVNLSGGDLAGSVVKSPAGEQVSFNTRPAWTYPDSLMGVISYIRQTFLDAQQFGAARAIYQRHPAGLQRPADAPALEALQPVLSRDLPVVFVADSALMMRRAQAIAREFNLRYILSGARQAYRMAPELKSVPVLVSVRWPVPPADKEDRADQPLRVIRDRALAPTTPAELQKAGVTFALVSGSGKAGDLMPGVRKAIDNGLSSDDALRALTLSPARIFGVDRQLGSLERGKIANVVVSDKPLFSTDAKVTRVFVDGREIRLPKDEKKEAAAETASSPADGTWNLSVRAPQGNAAITVTLRVEDGRLSGTFAGDRGSGDIKGGSFDGTNVEFTISTHAGNEAEASDWVFRGTVSGDRMQGNVSTTLGTFEFSGSRSK